MKNRGWIVTAAGTGLNLALGVLYAWSIFGKQFTEAIEKGGFGWTKTQATLPYTIAIACFALMMVPAGRLQDRFGPRVVATTGALLTGLGLMITSMASAQNTLPALLGFGLFCGTGFGLGYASATPAAVKWFPSEKKGLITGLVVSGFGLAPVYIAPLSKHLLSTYGLNSSFMILGISFSVLTVLFAQLIKNPTATVAAQRSAATNNSVKADYSYREMLRDPRFYMLYLEYACAATAGLMIIGHLAKIVAVQSGNAVTIGFFLVALLAIFNAGGRIVAGIVSDYIGRIVTLSIVFVVQAIVMFFFSQFHTAATFIAGAALVGFNYGACLSLFPATAADYWGTKNLGMNYGILFTAWGVGGVFGPILAGRIADATGSYALAFNIAGGFLMLAAMLTFLTFAGIGERSKKAAEAAQESEEVPEAEEA
ncbi:MAG: OFA family MFS transporter [Nitrospiraceae bacterium]|nr:OFA family MFS transporter [Nitrospiraceae bacterium]